VLSINNHYQISLNMEIDVRSDSKKQSALLMLYIRKNTITADVDHITNSATQELPAAHRSAQLNGVCRLLFCLDRDANVLRAKNQAATTRFSAIIIINQRNRQAVVGLELFAQNPV